MQNGIVKTKPGVLTDWAYEVIKSQILSLEILPGEQIDIEQFTEKLEVSRTPVREAFLRLASERLIEVQPRVGYFVVDITEQDIRDLFEIREIIETRAARRAAESLTDKELQDLVELISKSKKAISENDIDTYLNNEIAFHKSLQVHMKNQRLINFMNELDDLTYRERVMSISAVDNIKLTLVEHERIVQALLIRDGDKAAWFMGEHLKNVSDRLVEYLRLNQTLKETEINE